MISIPQTENKWAHLCIDTLLVGVAWWIAFWLRFNFEIPDEFAVLLYKTILWPAVSFAIGLMLFRVHRQLWRYTGLPELAKLGLGVILGGILTMAVMSILRYPHFPRSVLMLEPILVMLMLGAVRAGWRVLAEQKQVGVTGDAAPLLIIGTLQDASNVLRTIKGSRQWNPVGIVSPVNGEIGRSLQGIAVLGDLQSIAALAEKSGAQAALIASPAGSAQRRDALLYASEAGVSLLSMPRPDEWLQQESTNLHKVELEDLLGREPVKLDEMGLSALFAGRCVMVTGAGGSIGSELCRQLARQGIARLVCADISEFSVYKLEQDLRTAYPQLKVEYFTANVRELDRLRAIAQRSKPAVVFHAAAYKHVPLMEADNEIEAIRTNILGTLNAARVAGECGAERFVLISTDKAVNPTNIMGTTKRMAELVVQSVALEYPSTEFVSVRFGNVLGSSGSVVPLFTEQIARGGPITVTHRDIVRYFMTIPEAARLVLQAGLMGRSRQIYVLDMGEPVKIADLARMMIRLSGKTEQDVPIIYTGLRPGEKLFEELLADDETTEPTPHPKLRVAKTSGQQVITIHDLVQWINEAGAAPTGTDVRAWLRQHVPEYVAKA